MLVVDLTVELFEQQPPEIPAHSKVLVTLEGLAAFHKSCDYPTPQSLENFVIRASSRRVKGAFVFGIHIIRLKYLLFRSYFLLFSLKNVDKPIPKKIFISIGGSSETITLQTKCVINLKLLVWFGKSMLAFS